MGEHFLFLTVAPEEARIQNLSRPLRREKPTVRQCLQKLGGQRHRLRCQGLDCAPETRGLCYLGAAESIRPLSWPPSPKLRRAEAGSFPLGSRHLMTLRKFTAPAPSTLADGGTLQWPQRRERSPVASRLVALPGEAGLAGRWPGAPGAPRRASAPALASLSRQHWKWAQSLKPRGVER